MDYTTLGTTAPEPMSPATMIVWVVVCVAIYVYMAICLSKIAEKTNTPNSWLAWIPIANLVLMLQIARLSYWWIIGLLIPYINIIAIIYVWWKIAETRHRPGWWGILLAIPVVNFVVIYLLAFKEASSTSAPIGNPPANPVM